MPPQDSTPTPTPTPTPQNTPPQTPAPTTPPTPAAPGQPVTPEQALVQVAKKSMPKIAKIALIAFAVFMTLMVVFVVVVIKFTNNATADAVVVSDKVVNDIQADNSDAIYAVATTSFQESTSQSEAKELIEDISPSVQGEEKIVGKKFQTTDGKNYAAVVYSIDDKTYIRVVLEKQGSDWKVLNFRASRTQLEPTVE